MPDVLVLAFFRFARYHGLRGVFALQNLHAGLFIGADDQTTLLVEAQRVDIEERQVTGLGLEGRVNLNVATALSPRR